MKNLVLMRIVLVASLLTSVLNPLRSQDLPGAASNLMTAPAGSIVIPMDNVNQATTAGVFNLRAYGFIIHLMNHSYHPKWVIATGKAKDGIDFTVNAERLLPTTQPAASRDFRAGPFIFFPKDTADIYSFLVAFNAALPAGQKVNLYRTTADVTVDVRYKLTRIPRIGILNDGANVPIHEAYMTLASVPTANYTVTSGVNLINNCFTLVSEPHVDNTGPFIDSIRAFVLRGGNFLAQCHAIASYENAAAGRFQNSLGIVINNVNADATTTYPNADMAYAQMQGAYDPTQGGSIRTWDPAVGSVHQNNFYRIVANSAYPTLSGASASKLRSGFGGMVFFLGNHEYTSNTDPDQVNGIRMYMNAVLIPSGFNCNYAVWYVLPVEIMEFEALRVANGVEINWKVSEENMDLQYIVERSSDGRQFSALKRIDVTGIQGMKNYTWTDPSPNIGQNIYRLRVESINYERKYSTLKYVWINSATIDFSMFPNPATDQITVRLGNDLDFVDHVMIYDNSGRMVNKLEFKGERTVTINTSAYAGGLYTIRILTNKGNNYQSRVTILPK